MRLPARLLLPVAALTLALAGCSDSGTETDPPEAEQPSEGSTTAVAEPYLPVPDGVELTAQGSTLALDETATVAWEPRQGTVAALEMTVTSLEKATFSQFVGWEITDAIKQTSPYFVRATVKNVGQTTLGNTKAPLPVPLYAVDGQNRLVESSLFTGSFKPCDGATFPEKFKTGDRVKACMVYLAPGKGDLAGVSFRPTQEFNPIVWEGEVVPADTGGDTDDKAGKGERDDKGGKQGKRGD